MSQRLKVANRDWSVSNVISVTAAALASSMIQAMNFTKHYAKWCRTPEKHPPIGNDQHVTPLTPYMKTGVLGFTFPQLAGVTFLNPSLDLSNALEWDSPSPWQSDCKTKLNGTKKVAKWKLLLQQHRKEGVTVQKWGGRQMYWMLSRQRREIQSIAHSQPTRSAKEWVDYANKSFWELTTTLLISLISSSNLMCSYAVVLLSNKGHTGLHLD